uniref:Uncharacterized protein n=1 Tax=Myoviridae sp. ct8ME27 TaxID=2826622 RepID=A0A8S5N709_9CAUD|nr:MAG TPA: hypothetical protein [Myoviridae sp. ct8ME27]
MFHDVACLPFVSCVFRSRGNCEIRNARFILHILFLNSLLSVECGSNGIEPATARQLSLYGVWQSANSSAFFYIERSPVTLQKTPLFFVSAFKIALGKMFCKVIFY